jgi:GNAT superfamily N-acetyltransferase
MSAAMQQIHVRDARPDERGALQALTLAAYEEFAATMAPSAWAALRRALLSALGTDQPVERIVAERDGRLVGSVLLFPPARNAYDGAVAQIDWPEVRLLAVAPESRGQGVGAALMDECVRRARQTGATALGLHTSESMKAALRMYERMGFVRAPEYDFHPDGAELVQGYRLSLADVEPVSER